MKHNFESTSSTDTRKTPAPTRRLLLPFHPPPARRLPTGKASRKTRRRRRTDASASGSPPSGHCNARDGTELPAPPPTSRRRGAEPQGSAAPQLRTLETRPPSVAASAGVTRTPAGRAVCPRPFLFNLPGGGPTSASPQVASQGCALHLQPHPRAHGSRRAVPTLTAASLFPGLRAGHSCLDWSRGAQQCPARSNVPGTDV